MYAEERQQAMAALVTDAGRLSVVDLAARFDVTTETVRRDLSALERVGLVRRVHGGAVPAQALRVLEAADVEVGGFVLTKAAAQPSTYYYYYGGGEREVSGDTRRSRNGKGKKGSRSNTRTRSKRTERVDRQFPHASRAAEQRRSAQQNRAAWVPADDLADDDADVYYAGESRSGASTPPQR